MSYKIDGLKIKRRVTTPLLDFSDLTTKEQKEIDYYAEDGEVVTISVSRDRFTTSVKSVVSTTPTGMALICKLPSVVFLFMFAVIAIRLLLPHTIPNF